MGGSIGCGNVTPAVEYNIYSEPEASYIVFDSGKPIKMNGLDVTNLTDQMKKLLKNFQKLIQNRVNYSLIVKIFHFL